MKHCGRWLTAAALAFALAAGGCAKKQVRQEGEAGMPGGAERQGAAGLSGGPREAGLGTGGGAGLGGSSGEAGGAGQGLGQGAGPVSAGPVEPPPAQTAALDRAPEKPIAGGGLPGQTTSGLGRIYFDFDQAVITPVSKDTLAKNAAYMKDNPGARIRIEGHCDERGTTEYNLGLGDKRAKAAFQYLMDVGVDPNRMTVVSYGEEMPLDPAHNEDAWSKNRRAEFIEIQ